jgi:hypothetical protein
MFPINSDNSAWDDLIGSPDLQGLLADAVFYGFTEVIDRLTDDASALALIRNTNSLVLLSFTHQFHAMAEDAAERLEDIARQQPDKAVALEKEFDIIQRLSALSVQRSVSDIRSYALDAVALHRALHRVGAIPANTHESIKGLSNATPTSPRGIAVIWKTLVDYFTHIISTPTRWFDNFIDDLNASPSLDAMYVKIDARSRLILWPSFPLWYFYGWNLRSTWKLMTHPEMEQFPALKSQFDEQVRICSLAVNPFRGLHIYQYVKLEMKCAWTVVGMALWVDEEMARGLNETQAYKVLNREALRGRFVETSLQKFVEGYSKTSLPTAH